MNACMTYCEIINKSWGSNLHGFCGSQRKLQTNEIQFPHRLLPVVFETMNSRPHGPMHFGETTKIGAKKVLSQYYY